jgi:hypothetical protein
MEEASFDILTPVIEAATVLGSHYAKACGRNTVTGMDIAYGLMYAARNVTGRQIGSLYPEIYEDSSDSDENDIEVVDDQEETFTRYEGSEELFVNMNRCVDTWTTWEPTSPIEEIIKHAVDKANESVGLA